MYLQRIIPEDIFEILIVIFLLVVGMIGDFYCTGFIFTTKMNTS